MHLLMAGAGKSSMVAALLRLVSLQSGSIFVDGVDVKTVPLSLLRTAIGVVSQQPFLFEGDTLDLESPSDIHIHATCQKRPAQHSL